MSDFEQWLGRCPLTLFGSEFQVAELAWNAAIASMQGEAKFNATADADRLRSVARGMSYNDMSEATWKHVILEIAMRLDTGGYSTHAPDSAARISELEQQLEAARKDAERYRYLRDKSVQLFEIRHWVGYWDIYYGHRLDTVVDAAIRQIGGAE